MVERYHSYNLIGSQIGSLFSYHDATQHEDITLEARAYNSFLGAILKAIIELENVFFWSSNFAVSKLVLRAELRYTV